VVLPRLIAGAASPGLPLFLIAFFMRTDRTIFRRFFSSARFIKDITPIR
jgi:hypothetical protein